MFLKITRRKFNSGAFMIEIVIRSFIIEINEQIMWYNISKGPSFAQLPNVGSTLPNLDW